jgi:hypothetical protein
MSMHSELGRGFHDDADEGGRRRWCPKHSHSLEQNRFLEPEVADRRMELARSDDDEEVNDLIKIGMTRGLRHPRLAVQAIEAQLGQHFAKQSVDLAAQDVDLAKHNLDLAKQNVMVARLLQWATALAALAAFANVVAVVPSSR